MTEEKDLNSEEGIVMLNSKNEAAVALGSLGGKKRATNLTPERRKEIAANAAKARWAKRDEKQEK